MSLGGEMLLSHEVIKPWRCGMRILWLLFAALLAALPVAQAASPVRFSVQAGTRWETWGCIADSGVEGPTALILGGVHGNEPAGAVAAETVCGFAPARGKLVIVPRINPLGLERNIRFLPEIGDMNRVYPPDATNTPADRLGAEIISLMNRYNISLLVDLHEARTFHRLDHSSLGQTLLFAENSVSATLAMDAVDTVNRGIDEPVKKFAFAGYPIPNSSAWYAGKYLGIAAFTVETSSQQTLEERARQHLAMVRALLIAGGWLQP